MDRAEKHQQVETMHESFSKAQTVFLVDFKGLSVEHDTDLRARLRGAEVDYKVVKNRLAKLAIPATPMAGLDVHFVGPTAVALSSGDPVAVAKVLVDFAKDHPALEIKAGLLEGGEPMAAGEVEALSKLPSLPQLRAMLLSTLNAPATRLVMVLSEPGRQVARLLDARAKSLAESEG